MVIRKLRHFRVVGFLTLSLFLVLACGEQEDRRSRRRGDRSRERDETAQQQTEEVRAESSSADPFAAITQPQVWSDPAGLEYVYIPPGSFQMGCVPGDEECKDYESPRHLVMITRGFMMSRTEVTVRAYKRFCDATGRSIPSAPDFNPNWRNLNHPIVNVTWHDAVAYCEWARVRMPTEAEWEYAARGGQDGWKYVWGNNRLPVVNGIKQANVRDEAGWRGSSNIFQGYDDDYVFTSPVGSFAANGYGLYDMAGSVWEWCSDWYDGDYYSRSPSRDPRGPSSGGRRVLRGGSWYSDPSYLRVSYRIRHTPGSRSEYVVGFRCIRDLE